MDKLKGQCPGFKICQLLPLFAKIDATTFKGNMANHSKIQRKHNFKGYEKYKLFNLTNFISVLAPFRLMQQSLSRTRCRMKCLNSVLNLLSNGT